jgi:hypothetical protein
MAALQVNSRRAHDAKEHVPYRESRLTRMLQVRYTRRAPLPSSMLRDLEARAAARARGLGAFGLARSTVLATTD